MEMKRMIKKNPRAEEYYEYLDQHITGVQRAWKEMLRPFIEENFDPEGGYLDMIEGTISNHDSSKYLPDEFDAYCNYFYPSEGFEKDEDAFDLAWLMHLHRNPHHPQHWVLVRDSGEVVPLDMPFEYICEMLCDWSSFQYRDPDSTANNWYNTNKDQIQLSDHTRELVEEILEGCPKL